jgi:ABC-type sugar transport system permease subunit
MPAERPPGIETRESRLAARLIAPAVGIVVLVAIFPVAWTVWESLHLHDLRMPWRGQPFVGLENYAALLRDPRFGAALLHTAIFTAGSVVPELGLGMGLAVVLNRAAPGRGLARTLVLVPWAIPTVVAALLWRFMFDDRAGIVNALLLRAGVLDQPVTWLGHAATAWVPVILGDVWKTTPFVALLLLAGLQQIDGALYEAARLDGATAWQRFTHITLPLIKPALLVALIFRTLDAFRVFDMIYVMTGGGPGSATEPIALYTFTALLQYLRFGFGSALAVVVFLIAFGLALLYTRTLGAGLLDADR